MLKLKIVEWRGLVVQSPTYKKYGNRWFPYLWAIQGLNLGPPDYESVNKYTE